MATDLELGPGTPRETAEDGRDASDGHGEVEGGVARVAARFDDVVLAGDLDLPRPGSGGRGNGGARSPRWPPSTSPSRVAPADVDDPIAAPGTPEQAWYDWGLRERLPTTALPDGPVLVVVAHPDDETLALGGTCPTAASPTTSTT